MRSLLILFLLAATASAAPEPAGPHPRMLLSTDLRAAWQAQAKLPHGPVVGAIALCDQARTTQEHDHAVYQGAEWAKVLQACLVAYAATDSKDHAATAIKFTTALLDDLDTIGDHRGGDAAARRDDGYAIRNLGPYTALAYDWLHDQMPDDLRKRARARWKAWLDWYREKGYRHDKPGTNYHAGFLLTATMVAIAEAGDSGDGGALWREVETMWTKDMALALSDDGVLHGGDWPEGWQYGPLSVGEIALGARLMREQGVDVPGVSAWLHALLERHVHGLTPGDGVFAGGDTEAEAPYIKPSVMTLNAVALGDASPDDKRWARGELGRLQLVDNDYLLYDALAGVGDRPVAPPRASWPTWYLADATGSFFARTRWDDRAIWLAFTCHAAIEVDHRHPDAGNFVLSRGKDDVIVDPSPYGSQSTLTSNAPTVASAHLPKEYQPSQAFWSEHTGLDFATQRKSGTVAARCDYADAYKFQERKTDVGDAVRDLVVIPSADGTNAAALVIDRASTGEAERAMYLRFRTNGHFALANETATATIGATKLVIASVARSAGKAAVGVPSQKDCFKEGTVRGTCDAARFPVTDYRVEIPGPTPSAVHLIAATDPATTVTAKPLSVDGYAGVQLAGVRDATVIWRDKGGGTLAYTAPAGLHVVLDAPDADGKASVTAKPTSGGCAVEIVGGGTFSARPLVFTLDAACKATEDPGGSAASAAGTRASRPRGARSPRSGCCGAQATPGSSITMSAIVLLVIFGRRRRA